MHHNHCVTITAQEYIKSYSMIFGFHVVVQMSYQEKGSNDKIFPDYTNTDVALWDGEKDNIRLPKSVFSIGEFKAGYQKVQSSHKVLKDA
jgi:hypothetical protein